MKITLTPKTFTESWEGDGMRRGNNIRSHTWEGYLVSISLTPEEMKDACLVNAANPLTRQVSLDTTEEEIRSSIMRGADHLRWAEAWSKYFGQVKDDYWYVGTDYAPVDRPEVYDNYGNFIMTVPRDVEPGDFKKLSALVDEALRYI